MPQSLAKVYIHVVFSTMDRRPAIGDEWRDALFGVLGAAANNIGCQSLLTGGVAEHVHVSQSSVAAVREYIRRQPQHHATQTFQDEMREWLRRYEIEWDERNLWD